MPSTTPNATLPARATSNATTRTALTLAVAEVLGKVATLVIFVVSARLLGVSEFGVFSYGLGLGLLVAVVPSLGLDARVVQLGSTNRQGLPGLLAACLWLRAGLSAVVLATACVVTMLASSSPAHRLTLIALVTAGLVETFSDAFRAACGAVRQQRPTALVLVAQRFLALGLVIGGLVTWPGVAVAAVGYLVSTVAGVVGMALVARRAGVVPGGATRSHLRSLLSAVPVTGVGAIVSMALFRIDTVLVGLLLGSAAVGVYAVGYRLLETVLFVSWSISRAFVPHLAAEVDQPARMRFWGKLASTLVLSVYVPYGMVLAVSGERIVALLFGADYANRNVVLWLAAAPLLFGVAHLASSVLLARRPDPVVLVAGVSALAVNLVANGVLIPRWGIAGAACATTVSFFVLAAVNLRGVRRRIGSIFDALSVTLVVVAALVAAVPLLSPLSLLVSLPVAALSYAGAWWVLMSRFQPAVVDQLGGRRPRRTGAP